MRVTGFLLWMFTSPPKGSSPLRQKEPLFGGGGGLGTGRSAERWGEVSGGEDGLWTIEEQGLPQGSPVHPSCTPGKEAEVGLGSGCLTWAKRALGKEVGRARTWACLAAAKTAISSGPPLPNLCTGQAGEAVRNALLLS